MNIDRRRHRALRLHGVVALLAGLALGGTAGDAVAATATDSEAPRGAVGGVTSPASGTMMLSVRATDAGSGLASARASVDGVVVASADIGGPGCGDPAPDDGSSDPPVDGGCPPTVTDLQLAVPTATFGDGTHQLQVSVTDAAGNTALLVDQPLMINNTPPVSQSTALLTLGSGTGEPTDAPSGSAGGSGGTGTVEGTGSAAAAGRPACAAPRLSMFLKGKPLRVVKGVPVVSKNKRYRFSGTLTCVVGGRRVHAHSGAAVSLLNQIGTKTYRKSSVSTRSDGTLAVNLAYPSSRLLEFRYTSADGTSTRVRIRITVASAAKKKKAATKKKAS
jgi:hypothetical protein